MRVLHYCQHVLGMGHLFRSVEIAKALREWDVLLVTGGPWVELDLPGHVRREQLPGLRMDENFSKLLPLQDDPRPLEEIKAERQRRLLELFEEFRPDVFLVELYPFGRRAFAFELAPALELAGRMGCRRVCSLRDILVEKKDQTEFERRVLRLLNPNFDLLLVHGDPDVCSLERTFSRLAEVKSAVAYTGYVAPEFSLDTAEQGRALRRELGLPPSGQSADKLILASAGSGSVGGELLRAVLQAAPLLQKNIRLQVFSGPLLPQDMFDELRAQAAKFPHLTVERFSQRFTQWLAAADLSLSMGGYNTVMALAATGTYGLVLPFAQNREQRMRAEFLQQRGLLGILESGDLTPERLAGRSKEALERPPTCGARVNLKGARNSARCLKMTHAPAPRKGGVGREVRMPWAGFEKSKVFFGAPLAPLSPSVRREPQRLRAAALKKGSPPDHQHQNIDFTLIKLEKKSLGRGSARGKNLFEGFLPRQTSLDIAPLFEDFFARLQELCAGRGATVFFRADDVAVPGARLEKLLGLFLRHEVPLWLAVTPAWLQEGHWPWLLRTSREAALFLWHQHGWRHANHEVCGKKCEFGPGRALAHKRLDLQKGRDKLARVLGKRFTPVFTPPWNRMDADALGLLAELEFSGLSADAKLCALAEILDFRLPRFAVHLDLHTRSEKNVEEAFEQMLKACATALEKENRLGVMLHHQRMNHAAFAFLEEFLRRLPTLGLTLLQETGF